MDRRTFSQSTFNHRLSSLVIHGQTVSPLSGPFRALNRTRVGKILIKTKTRTGQVGLHKLTKEVSHLLWSIY